MRISCVVSILLSWLVSFYELIPHMFVKKKKRKKRGPLMATAHCFIMCTVLTLKGGSYHKLTKFPKNTHTNTKQDATTSSSHSEMTKKIEKKKTNLEPLNIQP